MASFTTNTTALVDMPSGAEFVVACEGTFGGGTFSVKYGSDGSYVAYSSGDTGDFTAAGERVFVNCGDTGKIQVGLSGSTGADVNYHVKQIEHQL